jgi:hypothetical protein
MEIWFYAISLQNQNLIRKLRKNLKEGDGAWGMPNQYHWKLSNPRLVVQKPYLGKLGFWEIPDEEVNTVSVSSMEQR